MLAHIACNFPFAILFGAQKSTAIITSVPSSVKFLKFFNSTSLALFGNLIRNVLGLCILALHSQFQLNIEWKPAAKLVSLSSPAITEISAMGFACSAE